MFSMVFSFEVTIGDYLVLTIAYADKVCLHPLTPPLQTSQSRTTLMTLCEDGSLRIYVTNKNSNTEYWLQQNFQPSSPLAVLKTRERSLVTSRRTGTPKFPIDFFESCQQLQPNEVEVRREFPIHMY